VAEALSDIVGVIEADSEIVEDSDSDCVMDAEFENVGVIEGVID
jgi:hypothetical protein